jgi:hypothetical protein
MDRGEAACRQARHHHESTGPAPWLDGLKGIETMTHGMEPLERLVFPTQKLVEEHPPVIRNRNKRIVLEIASPEGSTSGGDLAYSRWPVLPLPEGADPGAAAALVEPREGAYDYAQEPTIPGAVHWHVNFADPRLFVAYSGALFAQDEMQVAEHPALGSLKEALVAGGYPALTVEDGRPTPVLIKGVERRCRILTDRNLAEGRPRGLYGNAFGQASEEVVRRSVLPIVPPTITNIIAMAAPSGGVGPYQARDLHYVLDTAFTGFRAAVMESGGEGGSESPAVVHTGYWGCGAFGGDRVVMAALQALSGQMAGVHRLVLHTFDGAGAKAWEEAARLLEELAGEGPATLPELVDRILAREFHWGVSNGN